MPIESCTCPHCVAACRRVPGLFTPLEALRAVREGFADDIMSRWDTDYSKPWKSRDQWLSLLPRSLPIEHPFGHSPARNHRSDPFYCAGQCVFLNVDRRCEIHDSGFKPFECRSALICDNNSARAPTSASIRTMWNTSVGRHVVAIWKRELIAYRDAQERG